VPTLLLARHAQGSFGAADYDVLSDRGHEQAAALADDLERRAVRVDRVVSGALARQRDTAAPVAAKVGAEIEVDPRWDEYDSNAILARHADTDVRLEGHAGAAGGAVSSRDFQAVLDGALAGWIAAGAGGEGSWPAFRDRVAAALRELAAGLGSGQTALVCTSGGPLAAACVALLGLPDDRFVAFNRVVVNAGVTKVVHGRSGTSLVSFNEHAHLERPGGSLVTYR
jgi:broad specificity phosphatase PhoE